MRKTFNFNIFEEDESGAFENHCLADIFEKLEAEDGGRNCVLPELRISIGRNLIAFPMHAELFDALSDFLGEIRVINGEDME